MKNTPLGDGSSRCGRSIDLCALFLYVSLTALSQEPVSAAADEDNWHQAVHASHEGSIVFINVTATRSNGLVDSSTGTGFIVHPDGFVLTCNHVVPKKEPEYKSVEPTGAVGSRYEYPFPLQVIFRDEQRDLALLKLPGRASPWRSVASAAPGTKGMNIVSLGFPLSENLLSVPGSITGTDGRGGRWITNSALNRGMSGGPIFDRKGSVVAVAAGGYEEAQAINLIIPISFAKDLLEAVGSPVVLSVQGGQTITSELKPALCRHPAHGVEKWKGKNDWTADSGWRGGGSSPGEYCGAQLLNRQRQYPDRVVELLDSGEEHKSEYTPFKHDYYKYRCSFRELWDPVYKLVASEHCLGD